jgi:hypothetical protein
MNPNSTADAAAAATSNMTACGSTSVGRCFTFDPVLKGRASTTTPGHAVVHPPKQLYKDQVATMVRNCVSTSNNVLRSWS